MLTWSCGAGEAAKPPGALDYKQIYELPVGYYMLATNSYVPAYIQTEPSVVYLWANVLLSLDQTPDLGVMHARPLYDFHYMRKTAAVIQLLPKVYCSENDGKYEIGYYAPGYQTFYRWRDIALLKTEIPARFHAEEIMRKRETLKIIDIDMPSEQLQAYFRQWGE